MRGNVIIFFLLISFQSFSQFKSGHIETYLDTVNFILKTVSSLDDTEGYEIGYINSTTLSIGNELGKEYVFEPNNVKLGISPVYDFNVLFLECLEGKDCIVDNSLSGSTRYRNKVVIQLKKEASETPLANLINNYFSLNPDRELKRIEESSFLDEIKKIKNSLTSEQKRIALLIGNGKYHASMSSLTSPTLDVDLMEEVLEKLDFEVVKGINLGKNKMESKIQEYFNRVDQYDVGLIFYSGHGSSDINGRNYLIPIDFKLSLSSSQSDGVESINKKCILLDSLLIEIENHNNTTNIVIVDACRDIPNFELKSLDRLGFGSGFSAVKPPKGTIICYATSPYAIAYGSKKSVKTPSVFTGSFAKYIFDPLPFDMVMYKVKKEVFEVTGEQQVPWFLSSTLDPFYFTVNFEN